MEIFQMDEEDFWHLLWREALLAITAGWDLAIPIFGGVLAGYYLDRWLGTGSTFTLGLLVLGIGVGYYNLLRLIRRVEHRSRRRQDDPPSATLPADDPDVEARTGMEEE